MYKHTASLTDSRVWNDNFEYNKFIYAQKLRKVQLQMVIGVHTYFLMATMHHSVRASVTGRHNISNIYCHLSVNMRSRHIKENCFKQQWGTFTVPSVHILRYDILCESGGALDGHLPWRCYQLRLVTGDLKHMRVRAQSKKSTWWLKENVFGEHWNVYVSLGNRETPVHSCSVYACLTLDDLSSDFQVAESWNEIIGLGGVVEHSCDLFCSVYRGHKTRSKLFQGSLFLLSALQSQTWLMLPHSFSLVFSVWLKSQGLAKNIVFRCERLAF